MIRKIILVGQGPNDIGFLEGLRDRLGCDAELLDYTDRPVLRQRGTYTRRKDADLIWREFQAAGGDLLIRLTDGDTHSTKTVINTEIRRYPAEAEGLLVCGVCDRDVEHWMGLDRGYLCEYLDCLPTDVPNERQDFTRFVKSRLERIAGDDRDFRGAVAAFVRRASRSTMKAWLEHPSFATFYDDCRQAAIRDDCPVPNERD
ncbi:MAG: hypothetical protein HY718_09550 [Planctomycetes bacterium]|nr:hypothetical protein [Planctomycetota bacterium]